MSGSTVVTDISDAIEAALDGGDTATVVTSYRALSVSDKAHVRASLRDGLASAVRDLDLDRARAFQAIMDSIAAPVARVTPATDWNALVADRLAALEFAARAIRQDCAVIGVPDDITLDWDAIRESVDANTHGNVSDQITSLITVTGTKARSSVAAHVAEVISDLPSGTFLTVAQVAGRVTAAYPAGDLSDGAVAARLFPANGNCTLADVIPTPGTGTRPRGLTVA